MEITLKKLASELNLSIATVSRALQDSHEVSEKTASYVKSTRGYIKENPLQSVVVAATAGLALGSLATMFSRRS